MDQEPVTTSKPIYGDITNRLFAAIVDLAILYLPLNFLTNIGLGLIFPVANQFLATRSKVLAMDPQYENNFSAMINAIVTYYPQDAVLIIRQLVFVTVFQLILIGLYIILFTYKSGATPGKKIVGLKVVDNITGKGITLSQSIIRYLGYMVSTGLLGIGLLTASTRKNKRTWHDYIADTVVIYDPNRWYARYLLKLTDGIKKFFGR